MFQAYLKLDTRSITKKGNPIKVYVSGKGGYSFISTGHYSFSKHWKNGRLLRSHPTYSFTQSQIKKAERNIQDMLLDCFQMTFKEAVSFVKAGGKIKKETMLFDFWETIVSEKKDIGRVTTPYDAAKKELKKFLLKEDIPINDINYEFLKSFVNHKHREGCNEGGVNYYLKTIRTVFLEAQRRSSLNIKTGNPFIGLIKKGQKKRPVTLTRKQFIQILNYTPKPSTTKTNKENILRRRDLFLFQLYIGGHDFVEVASLRWSDIRGGRIKFYRQKNRSRDGIYVNNEIIKKAKKIIELHGTKDKERVFDFITNPKYREAYNENRRNYSRALSTISKDLNINSISSKSARFIFRTWAGECEADILTTMQIQGHKPKDITFGYQGRLSDNLNDKTLKKIIKWACD